MEGRPQLARIHIEPRSKDISRPQRNPVSEPPTHLRRCDVENGGGTSWGGGHLVFRRRWCSPPVRSEFDQRPGINSRRRDAPAWWEPTCTRAASPDRGQHRCQLPFRPTRRAYQQTDRGRRRPHPTGCHLERHVALGACRMGAEELSRVRIVTGHRFTGRQSGHSDGKRPGVLRRRTRNTRLQRRHGRRSGSQAGRSSTATGPDARTGPPRRS